MDPVIDGHAVTLVGDQEPHICRLSRVFGAPPEVLPGRAQGFQYRMSFVR